MRQCSSRECFTLTTSLTLLVRSRSRRWSCSQWKVDAGESDANEGGSGGQNERQRGGLRNPQERDYRRSPVGLQHRSRHRQHQGQPGRGARVRTLQTRHAGAHSRDRFPPKLVYCTGRVTGMHLDRSLSTRFLYAVHKR